MGVNPATGEATPLTEYETTMTPTTGNFSNPQVQDLVNKATMPETPTPLLSAMNQRQPMVYKPKTDWFSGFSYQNNPNLFGPKF